MSVRLPVAIVTLVLIAFVALWLGRGPTVPPDGAAANPVTVSYTWRPDPGTLASDLTDRARELSRSAYASLDGTVPTELAALDFDAYRSIRFRPDAAVWRGEGAFEIQLFHLGSIHTEPVRIHLVEGDTIRTLEYDPALFDFDGTAAPAAELPAGAVPAFAGFRVHYPLNRADVMDELGAFLGASYFRVLSSGQEYGLSARGLAIDPAVDGPEEFPAFREYWIERPDGEKADALTIHALLEGPSVVGAYSFELRPGSPTTVDVDARLFARRDIRKLGVAPMSSMFLHAPGHGPGHDDFRPRVHDSDGLQMLTGRGEWIWRPLGNGPGLHVTSLRDEAPAGFGLFQRARDFDDYLDLEARYHLRPSYWIKVIEGDWGGGGVELLEIPSPSEFSDNIAAYWVPDRPFLAGEERRFVYRLESLGDAHHPEMAVASVARTAIAWDALPGQTDPPPRSRRRVVVDFTGGSLTDLAPDEDVQADLTVLRGTAEGVMVQPLPGNTGQRVTFTMVPDGDHPADMRLLLVSGGEAVSETWSYVWYPSRVP